MIRLFFGCYFLLIVSCVTAQDTTKVVPTLELGGALRFNYNLSTWKKEQVKRGGDFGYDVFRINAKSTYKKFQLNAEFRFYSAVFGGPMLKQGWVQYNFDESNNLQLGLTQVCFGNTTYNSYSWFFSMNYYVGLEDDHDMGVKYTHNDDKWDYSIAFFKNAEEYNFGDLSDVSTSRYAYDVASIDLDGDGDLEFRNKEINQLNLQVNRKFNCGKSEHRLGASAMYGGLLNLDNGEIGSRYALDLHYLVNYKRFGLKAQCSAYSFSPKNDSGESTDVIAMAAYGAPYLVAAKAALYTFGLSYTIPIEGEYLKSIALYNDFGLMDKEPAAFDNSIMNVTGFLLDANPMYAYVDFAFGKNQPWLGGDWTEGLATGDPNASWEMRFNVNLGYYF